MRLTTSFSAEQYAAGMESWTWLDFTGKRPIGASLFGDVFLAADDGCWFLDSLEGTLSRPWSDRAAMLADLSTPAGRTRYLFAELAVLAVSRGLVLSEAQVYDFTQPPVLGGSMELDNLQVLDFVVALNLAGQVHDQVRGLPPGTRISGITIS